MTTSLDNDTQNILTQTDAGGLKSTTSKNPEIVVDNEPFEPSKEAQEDYEQLKNLSTKITEAEKAAATGEEETPHPKPTNEDQNDENSQQSENTDYDDAQETATTGEQIIRKSTRIPKKKQTKRTPSAEALRQKLGIEVEHPVSKYIEFVRDLYYIDTAALSQDDEWKKYEFNIFTHWMFYFNT